MGKLWFCIFGLMLLAVTASSSPLKRSIQVEEYRSGEVKDISNEKDKNYTVHGHAEFRHNDVELDEDEEKELFGKTKRATDPVSRKKRAAVIKDNNKLWKKQVLVPYEIVRRDFNNGQYNDILATFAFLETETCITFREKTVYDVPYVKIADCGGGCWAHLGQTNEPSYQKVCLGDGCKWPGLYAHELGHTLGLQHEHQRPDRDDEIMINTGNITEGSQSSFIKFNPTGVLTNNYDFASVMHYERTSFAKPGTITITAREDWNNKKLGEVWWKMYSYNDVRMLNRAYGCGESCHRVSCSDGFVNENCECVTSEAYYARHCRNTYNDRQCDEYAEKGECEKNPGWMYFRCRKSCKACYN